MSTLSDFLAFVTRLEDPVADFEDTDDRALIEEMLGDRAAELEVFGMHGSGSLLAIWKVDGKEPVIWADTGFEASVIAGSVDDFLRILPYDTGFIYDLAFAGLEPTEEEAREQLSAAAEQNPAQPQLIAWLEERGLGVASDPAAVVKEAKGAFPDLASLIG